MVEEKGRTRLYQLNDLSLNPEGDNRALRLDSPSLGSHGRDRIFSCGIEGR